MATTAGDPRAELLVTPGAGIGGSTYNSNSFVLENLSTGGQQLTSVTIDLSGSILTGMVYDPTGQAGDTVAKPFTIDGQVGSFTVVSATLGGGSDTAGYKTLTLQLQNFNPGDTLSFSIDVDPHSIQGAQQQVGPDGTITGAVAGVELTGAATTFNFGGTTLTNELFKQSTSVGGATVLVEPGLPSAPTVTVTGVSGTTGIVSSAQQTVNVSGPANGTVRVLVMEGGAFTQGVPSTAPKLGPFQANSAVEVKTYDVALDGQGHGHVQVTLTDSVPEGGINLITAATMASDGAFGPASTPIALEIGTPLSGPPVPAPVHANDLTYSSTASGFNHFIDLLNFEASYSDLIHAFGVNQQAMQEWYNANEPNEKRIETFDGLDYIASYGDLINAFRSGGSMRQVQDLGATHFIANGLAEGRTTTFNGLDYIASYGDLMAAFGADNDAGAFHYIESGASEGRTTTFDGLDYIASYSDLIRAFGANEQAGAAHFITNGAKEGRSAGTFDGLSYIAQYTDLMKAFGANNDAGASHYITNGFSEGRSTRFDVAGYEAAHPDLQGRFATNDQFLTAYINTFTTTGHFLT